MTTELKTSINTGQLIPNFHLSAANRPGPVGPSDYKQYRNLVLIFFRTVECLKCKQLLREIAENYGEYQKMEAEVLAISRDEIDHLRQMTQDPALPFPVLSDGEGRVTDLYLHATEQDVNRLAFGAAIFIADRWGEVFNAKRIQKDQGLPSEAEIRGWLEFIELQCEECFPPEWPV